MSTVLDSKKATDLFNLKVAEVPDDFGGTKKVIGYLDIESIVVSYDIFAQDAEPSQDFSLTVIFKAIEGDIMNPSVCVGDGTRAITVVPLKVYRSFKLLDESVEEVLKDGRLDLLQPAK